MEANRELVHQQDRSSFRSANCPLTDTSYPPRCKPSVICCPYSPSCLEEVFSETGLPAVAVPGNRGTNLETYVSCLVARESHAYPSRPSKPASCKAV